MCFIAGGGVQSTPDLTYSCRNAYKSKNIDRIFAKKHYLTAYQEGGDPPIMEKYNILRYNNPSFVFFVVVTAFW